MTPRRASTPRRWLVSFPGSPPSTGRSLSRLPEETRKLRDEASRAGQHKRTPAIAADLGLGLRYFLNYAREAGAVGARGVRRALGAWVEGHTQGCGLPGSPPGSKRACREVHRAAPLGYLQWQGAYRLHRRREAGGERWGTRLEEDG